MTKPLLKKFQRYLFPNKANIQHTLINWKLFLSKNIKEQFFSFTEMHRVMLAKWLTIYSV